MSVCWKLPLPLNVESSAPDGGQAHECRLVYYCWQ